MAEIQTTAHELAKHQKSISVAEFFSKNRHLLGFDNPRKALLTTVKEAVDNSLDACEEARILPEISIEIIDMGGDRFRLIIEDNGPGIVKKQVPNIFAKLLYGSKFHSLKMSRGQQGIGISASVMYGQLTTGRPAKVTSKIHKDKPAYYCELVLDTQTNEPDIKNEKNIDWYRDHGTKIEIDLEAIYQRGQQSVETYLKETAIVNPHATIIYTDPKANQIIFPRVTDELPAETKEIKPHPYGLELGLLIKMFERTTAKTIQQFLMDEFSRVTTSVAKEILEKAAIPPKTSPSVLTRESAEKLIKAIKKTKIMNPPTDCVTPVGAELLERGIKKEINAEFYTSATRPPSVYRGNPFIIEAALAYGGELPKDKQAKIMRFANRVPLLYQQGACITTKSIAATNFKSYGLNQPRGSLPVGPCVILVHIASVWVPFTSESKEAIAHYEEIEKEVKLAVQECGRQLGKYLSKKQRLNTELKKRSYIEKYIPHVSKALKLLIDLTDDQQENVNEILKDLLEETRGKIKDIKHTNTEYDADFAKIGAEEPEDDNEEEDE